MKLKTVCPETYAILNRTRPANFAALLRDLNACEINKSDDYTSMTHYYYEYLDEFIDEDDIAAYFGDQGNCSAFVGMLTSRALQIGAAAQQISPGNLLK
jgi:hypothetical protein